MDLSKYIGSKGSKYLDGSKYINDDWDIFSSEQSTGIFKDATIYDIWLNTNTCGGDRFKENKTMENQEGIECMDKISINHWMTMNRLSWLVLLFGFIHHAGISLAWSSFLRCNGRMRIHLQHRIFVLYKV